MSRNVLTICLLVLYCTQKVTNRDVQKVVKKMDSRKIAQKLIELRGEKSRESVAKALDISLSTLSMYEIGARIPRDENKEKIARYYGKTVDEIFFA